jgi:hypothetical protein
MPYARFYWALAWEDANRKMDSVGNLLEPVILPAVTGTVFRRQVSVAASTTAIMFDVANDLGDFDVMVAVSDKSNVILEWTTDKDNSVGDEYATIGLYATFPQPFGTDDSYANYTPGGSGFSGGTLDKIERVRVRNLGTTAAVVDLIAIT